MFRISTGCSVIFLQDVQKWGFEAWMEEKGGGMSMEVK